MSKYILDACALIAVLNGEKGAESVRDIIDLAADGSTEIYMSIVNLLEVYYGVLREYDKNTAENLLTQVDSSPIVVVDTIYGDLFREAGRLKSSYKMSLADSFAVAQAIVLSGALVTSDHHEFEAVAKSETVVFEWFR
jgi:predicted nucleic acid-binding protein